jgi:hypothetical protein
MFTIRFGTPTGESTRSTRRLKLARIHFFPGLILAVLICCLYGYRSFFDRWQQVIFDHQYPPPIGYPCAFLYVLFSFFAFGALFWFLEAVRLGLVENRVVPISIHVFAVVMMLVLSALLTFLVVPICFFRYLYHLFFS